MIKYLKSVIVALIVSASMTNLSAQEFYAGPVVGASFSQIDGDAYSGYNKLGLVVGGFVGRQISEHWKTQLEIVYVQKGSRATPDIEAGDYSDYLADLKYIQFPLTMQLITGKFQFEGGLCFGSLLSSNEEAYGAPIPEQDQIPFKNTEWSTVWGFSYHITDQLMINCRFNYSLLRVREPYGGSVPVYDPHWDLKKPGQYNNVVCLSLYYDLFNRNR
jgi:hypothetical protein